MVISFSDYSPFAWVCVANTMETGERVFVSSTSRGIPHSSSSPKQCNGFSRVRKVIHTPA